MLCFLDRNALSDIKKICDGSSVSEERKRVLSSLDKTGNVISTLVALQEGSNACVEDREQIFSSIKRDIYCVEDFFKYAKNDSKIILEDRETLSDMMSQSHSREIKINDYIEFISDMQRQLYQPIAKQRRLVLAKEIISLAVDKGISESHIVVFCVLAALYRNSSAVGVLKARKNQDNERLSASAYNTVSDLLFLSRVLNWTCRYNSDYRIVTFDRNLEEFFRYIDVKAGIPINGGVKVVVDYNQSIFTEANQEEKDELFNLMRS